MKKVSYFVITTVAAALLATGCGQKQVSTSEAAPPAADQPGASAQLGEPRRAPAGEKRAKGERGREAGSASTPAAPTKVVSVTLPEGTPLKVRTTTAISTKTAAAGDGFEASLMDDLVQDGVTVAPKGATVRGKVVESDPGGRVKGRAVLSIRLTELQTDREMIPISTDAVSHEAASTKKKDALKVGIGAGLGAAIGAIAGGGKGAAIGSAAGAGAGGGAVLLTRGDAAVLPAESAITFRLTAPAKVR